MSDFNVKTQLTTEASTTGGNKIPVPPVEFTLTTNNQTITTRNVTTIKLNSNENADPTNRRFALAAGLPGQVLTLEWKDSSQAELQATAVASDGTITSLQTMWFPAADYTLQLMYIPFGNEGRWIETSRVPSIPDPNPRSSYESQWQTTIRQFPANVEFIESLPLDPNCVGTNYIFDLTFLDSVRQAGVDYITANPGQYQAAIEVMFNLIKTFVNGLGKVVLEKPGGGMPDYLFNSAAAVNLFLTQWYVTPIESLGVWVSSLPVYNGYHSTSLSSSYHEFIVNGQITSYSQNAPFVQSIYNSGTPAQSVPPFTGSVFNLDQFTIALEYGRGNIFDSVYWGVVGPTNLSGDWINGLQYFTTISGSVVPNCIPFAIAERRQKEKEAKEKEKAESETKKDEIATNDDIKMEEPKINTYRM